MLVSVVDVLAMVLAVVLTTALSLGLTLPSLPPGQRVIAGGGGLVGALLPEALGVQGHGVAVKPSLVWLGAASLADVACARLLLEREKLNFLERKSRDLVGSLSKSIHL